MKDPLIDEISELRKQFTELKTSEMTSKLVVKELLSEKNKAQKYLNVAEVIFVVINADQKISLINKKGCKVLGYKEEEIIGKNWFDSFLPERIKNELKSVFEKLIAGDIESVEYYENPVLIRSGEERIISWHNTVLRSEEGKIIATLGSGEDITERKRAEAELTKYREDLEELVMECTEEIRAANKKLQQEIIEHKQTKEMLRSERDNLVNILDSMDDGVYIVNQQYDIEYVNLSLKKGFGPFEGIKCYKYFHNRKEVCPWCKNEDVFAGETVRWEWCSFKNHKTYDLIDIPLRKPDGSISKLEIFRDITERKAMEKQLLQAEKLKSLGELAWGVAHDFNNVLAVILGRAQLLKMILELPPGKKERRRSTIKLKEGLEVIERASQDGAVTVRRIQEFSRRKNDNESITPVNLNEMINHVLEFTKGKWKNGAESKGIKINVKKDLSPLPLIAGSASELREVFTNLLNNAIDAMSQGGQIKIKTFKEDSYAYVKIEDTGTGIPELIKDKIFNPFFTTKGVKSSGLGLSVSYGIINRHRGTIKVDSVEGKGTTFTIKLPISEKGVVEKVVEPILSEQKKARILVIEDEEQVRNLLSAILIKEGHEVKTATDGKQGVRMFKRKNYDLVLTDLGMPGMSGWQVAEKIKSINARVPVALITGWDINLVESQMRESGVDLVVRKPFEVDQVLRLVQEGMTLRDSV